VNNKEKGKKTVKFSIIASILLSLIVILVVLYLTINPSDIELLKKRNIHYEFFATAIFLNFLSWCIWGLRLKILSNASDKNINISWWKSTKIIMANHFLAGITPSMAGGEPVRIYLLNKEGMSTGCATASVLGERLIDAIFLLFCVPFALFILRNNLKDIGVSVVGIGLTVSVIIFLIAIFLFFYAIFKPEKTKKFLIWLNKKFSRFSNKKGKEIVERISGEVDNFHCSMMVFLKEKKGIFVLSSVLTVFMWLCSWLIASCILMGLGLDPFVVESIAAQVFLIILVMMPTTPGAAGVTEGGASGLYYFIVGESNLYLLGIFVLIFRSITYYMNLIVGVIFQYRIFKSVLSFSKDIVKKQDSDKKC
jgi:glycosyltransferase 2 family protein